MAATALAVAFASACGAEDGAGDQATGGFEAVEGTNGGFVAVEPPPEAPAEPAEEPAGEEGAEATTTQGEVQAIGSSVPLSEVSAGEADFVVEFLEVDIGEEQPIQAIVPPPDQDRATQLFLDDVLGEGSTVEVRSSDGTEWEFVDVVD